MISFDCAQCLQPLQCEPQYANGVTRCPRCGVLLRMPCPPGATPYRAPDPDPLLADMQLGPEPLQPETHRP